MASAVRGVLFDVDGTLVDHERAVTIALASFLAAEAAAFPPHVDALWRSLGEACFGAYLRGETTFTEQRRARVRGLLATVGRALTNDEADERYARYLRMYEASWRSYPDAEQALLHLRDGYRLGIVTNGDHAQQLRKIEAVGLSGLFDAIVVSSEAGIIKPNPEVFLLACARLRLPPRLCAYIGDRLDTDARAASAAGLVGIWLCRSGQVCHETDITTIGSLSELVDVLS